MKEKLTTEEAAKFLGYSETTLRNWRLENNPDSPRYYKPMGKIFYFTDDLKLWIEGKGGKLGEQND